MEQKHRFLKACCFGYLMLLCMGSLQAQPSAKPYVVLISLDGFRWDYPEKYATPNLNKMAEEGVKAASLIPSFPTKTFPNHYTILTGLYPDHHGIVANKFFDPETGLYFALNTPEKLNPIFYGGTPLWINAEEQGVKTASYNWPGSEVLLQGKRPGIWMHYSEAVPIAQRFDTVLHWLQLPEDERPQFISMYIEQPDKLAHEYGPDAPQVARQVQQLDSLIGSFRQQLGTLPFGKDINLVVLSDHGMAAVDTGRTVNINKYIPQHWLQVPTMGSPVVFLKAAPGFYDSIQHRLKVIPNVKGYPSGKIPNRLHFGKNKRSLDFVLVADDGWSLITNPAELVKKGNHGFDNKNKDMHAIFYATGPAFKKGVRYGSFENIHIKSLLAHILHVAIPPDDGNFKKLKKMLAPAN